MAAPSSARTRGVSAVALEPGDDRWTRFVAAHPDALPFHRWDWIGALAECYRFRPRVIALADADGELAAGLPLMEVADPIRGRRWIALPFTDRCPPLFGRTGLDEELGDAVRAAARERRAARVDVHAPLSGLHVHPAATMQELDLTPGLEAVERAYSSQHRRNARKAEREGVVVRRGESETDLTEAYYQLHLQTRHRLGVPVQPRRFFRTLWRRVLEPGGGHVLLAYADGIPIAGAVFLYAGRTVVYKYGASDAATWKLRPNNLLFTQAIRWSAESGYERFDFGRSDFADEGLRRFKTGWGAEETTLVYSSTRAVAAAPQDGAQDDEDGVLTRVIRRSPPVVCRAIGETLYRYAA